jgi:TetR/AcrR family transcriptional regulator
VLGHWQRYAKSGFANKPSDHAAQQIAMLLA